MAAPILVPFGTLSNPNDCLLFMLYFNFVTEPGHTFKCYCISIILTIEIIVDFSKLSG